MEREQKKKGKGVEGCDNRNRSTIIKKLFSFFYTVNHRLVLCFDALVDCLGIISTLKAKLLRR